MNEQHTAANNSSRLFQEMPETYIYGHGRLSLCLISSELCHENYTGEWRSIHVLLISPLDGGEWPSNLTPGKEPLVFNW
jgi:hypothetical protein